MKPLYPSLLQLVRRFVMVVGFGFFVMFAYKATQDVSNQALASESPSSKKPPVASLAALPATVSSNYQSTSSTINTPVVNDISTQEKNYHSTAHKEKLNKEHLRSAETLQNAERQNIKQR